MAISENKVNRIIHGKILLRSKYPTAENPTRQYMCSWIGPYSITDRGRKRWGWEKECSRQGAYRDSGQIWVAPTVTLLWRVTRVFHQSDRRWSSGDNAHWFSPWRDDLCRRHPHGNTRPSTSQPCICYIEPASPFRVSSHRFHDDRFRVGLPSSESFLRYQPSTSSHGKWSI